MGMRIQGGATGYAIAAQDNQWQQRRQNFDALSQAVSGGNLSSATDALTKIQASLPSGQSIDPNSFLGKIDAALQSGDIITAQQLLAARSTGSGDQSASAGSVQQAGAASAANGTTATGATSGASATSGRHGLHRHHGGGSSSPARDLSQAIQSGDTAKAQSSMLAILTDLQQVAALGSLSSAGGSGGASNSPLSSAVSAATNLLQNPGFQELEDAVAKGDSTAMQSAWAKLTSGPSDASTSTVSAAPSVTTSATQVSPTV